MPEVASIPQRLALVIHGLSGGGAERVLTDMANHWARAGLQVTLITLASAETDVFPVDTAVCRVGLDVMRESRGSLAAIRNNVPRAAALRRALRQANPDFVISFTDQINVLTLLATYGTRLPVIVCERSDPRHHPLGRAWSFLRRRLYRRCFAAVVQTAAVREFVQPLTGRRPVYVIPNVAHAAAPHAADPKTEPIEKTTAEPMKPTPGHSKPTRRLIAMGRLSPEKGFDRLIDAFASLAAEHPRWSLEIFGTGPARDALQAKIADLELASRVRLAGWTDDAAAEFSRADLFALPSHYEGFPNALLDAMACGLPAVSFNCPSGPAEIIRHQVDGLLVEPHNVPALAAALGRLMSDDRLRRDYAARAVDVVDRFSAARFSARWQAVFTGAAPDDPRFAPPAPSPAPTKQD